MFKKLIKFVLGPCDKLEDSNGQIHRQISLQRLDNCPYDWTYDTQVYVPIIYVNYNKNHNKIYIPPGGLTNPIRDTLDTLVIDLNCLVEHISLSPDNQETDLEPPREIIERWTNFANEKYIKMVANGYLNSCTFDPNNWFYTPENERKEIIKAINEAPNIARIEKKGYKHYYNIPNRLKGLQIETGGNIPRCDMPAFTINQFRDNKWE